MSSMADWERRNENHVSEIAADDSLSNTEYLEILQDLDYRVSAAIAAKQAEMDLEDDDAEDQ